MLRKLYRIGRRLLVPLSPRRLAATVRWAAALTAEVRGRRREPRLTVGVDISPLWEARTGVGWYLYELLAHLADRDDVRLRLYGPTAVFSSDLEPPVAEPPSGPALERVVYRVPEGLALPSGLLVRLLRRLEPLLIAADANRVLFAPNYFLPRRFTLAPGDLVATIHDLGFRQVPWTLRPETLGELGESLERTCLAATHLITPSRAVRGELARFGYARPARVTAVHHGPGQRRVAPGTGAAPSGVPERYALFVGTLEPRKNLEAVVDAWWHLRGRGIEPPALLICGRYGWHTEGIRRHVEEAEAAGLARHLGYVSEGELGALLAGALFLVFPTLYEGFGLPVLEAMAAGVPVLASDLAVLREVAGDAALYAPSGEPERWAEAAALLAADAGLRRRLAERGRERADRFDWYRAAEETVAVFRRAAAPKVPCR